MRRDGASIKVGALVLAGLAVLAVAIFLVGEREFLFVRKNRYYIEFENVSNLTVDNPVQLNGVTVGKVEEIILPEAFDATLQVWITVDRRHAERIREDSLARIQTLGLLGDKFIAVSSGSRDAAMIAPGGQIAAAPATEIDQLLTSGGDVVDNLVVAASSLSNILARMERGEGLLGALITGGGGDGETLNETVTTILTDLRDVLHDVKRGEGSLGRLLQDDRLALELEGAVTKLSTLATVLDEGEGLLPALLHDPALRDRLASSLENLDSTTKKVDELIAEVGESDGLLPRLLKDQALADELLADLRGLLAQLNEATAKLNQGDGTAARLLNDPSVYEAIGDILVGINESRMLRWLLRNRQQAGIRERYREAQDDPSEDLP